MLNPLRSRCASLLLGMYNFLAILLFVCLICFVHRGDLESIKILVDNGVDFLVGNDDMRTVITNHGTCYFIHHLLMVSLDSELTGCSSSCIKWHDQCFGLFTCPGISSFVYGYYMLHKCFGNDKAICLEFAERI